MTAIAQQLERKLKQWPTTTARRVEKLVSEIIERADEDTANASTAPKPHRSRKTDPLFADTAVWEGPVPPDSSVNHDKYLYGDGA